MPGCASRLGSHSGEADPQGGRLGKLLNPAGAPVWSTVIAKYGVSEWLVCRILGQHRSTQRKIPKRP